MARALADEPGPETWARAAAPAGSAAIASGTRCNTQGDPAPCRALPVEGSAYETGTGDVAGAAGQAGADRSGGGAAERSRGELPECV